MRNNAGKKGIVLLVVLGVLALMSVLAITFVSMTRLERSISRNYVDRTRAILVAESGLEYTFSRLNAFQGGALLPQEFEAMRFIPGQQNDSLESAQHASFQDENVNGKARSGTVGSSYTPGGDYYILKVEDESGKLNLNETDSPWNLDDDPELDDRETDSDFVDAPLRLTSMIKTLAGILYPDMEGLGGLIAIELLLAREKLQGGKFSSMDQVRQALVGTGTLTAEQYENFAKNTTIYSWQDPNVIRPTYTVELSLPDGEAYPGPGSQYGVTDGGGNPGFDYDDVRDGIDSIHIYLTRDLQTKYFELEPRCPVNVNTASLELIQAMLSPLAGWYLQEGPPAILSAFEGVYLNYYYYLYEWFIKSAYWYNVEGETFSPDPNLPNGYYETLIFGKMKIVKMDIDLADSIGEQLYNRIHVDNPATVTLNDPEPFATWQEFYRFIDRFIDDPLHPGDDPIAGFTKYHADLLKANCNPNSRLNDYNPDAHIFQYVDKSQLTQYTTEFCFEPAGTFQISSLGIIKNSNNEIAAKYQIHCVAKVFEILRISSQAQFMEGYETEDDLINYFDESLTMPTAGAGNAAAANGFTLQSYPEPVINADSKPFTNPDTDRNYLDDSLHDGYLSIATWQNSRHAQSTDTYLINFNTTLEPNSDPYIPLVPPTWEMTYYPYRSEFGFYFDHKADPDIFASNTPTVNRLTHGKNQKFLPGVLYPDGAYSGRHRCLGFNAVEIGDTDNHTGMIGSINFWIKPNFDVDLSNRPRLFFSMGQNNFRSPNGRKLGLWYFPHGNAVDEAAISRHFYELLEMPPRTLVFGWNCGMNCGAEYHYNGLSRGTSTITHQWHGPGQPGHGLNPLYNVDAHQWSHIAISWNLYGTAGEGITSMSDFAVNGEVVSDNQTGNHSRDWDIPWSFEKISIFHYTFVFRNVAYLGGSPYEDNASYSADSTYDDVFAHRIKLSATENASFYSWGRYYHCADTTRNGEIGRYTSPGVNLQRVFKLTPDKQIDLRSISWTLYWPMTNRAADNADFYIATEGVDVNELYPDDPVIPDGWDPILVDVAVNDYWFYDNDKSQMPSYAGGSRPKYADGSLMRINLGRDDQFSFRVYFHMGDNTALYNAPVLDDITFTFAYTSPKILFWQAIIS
ncbi:PilX N-terminal domain-containing pilus assembly protein [Planctomycetota bacterium]